MGKNTTTMVFSRRKKGKDETSIPQWLKPYLIIISGKDIGQKYEILEHCTVLGRGPDSDLIISDPSISRRHASIVYKNLEFRLRDLDSANGTLLNGYEVKEYAIRNGDKITMGETVLQFQLEKKAGGD